MYASTGLTPAARTRMRTCPGPGVGSGTSSIFMTSGGPNERTRIAFMPRKYTTVPGPSYLVLGPSKLQGLRTNLAPSPAAGVDQFLVLVHLLRVCVDDLVIGRHRE